MMEEVPKADVIVTNPSHFAVALKYDAQGSGAPVLVAKGGGFNSCTNTKQCHWEQTFL